MKKIIIIITCCIICVQTIQAQKIVQLQLSQSTNNPIISLLIENNVYFNVTTDGSVVEWGIDFGQGRMYYYPGKLDKYMGRVEYYSATDNESLKGKVKYVGATAITYFTKSENDFLAGKIKSIGNAQVNYYQAFDEDAVKGKIKSVGQTNLSYFANFDNEAFKGKLKSVGNTNITYYASFDDKAFKGKLKSIGTFNFVYYSSFETRIAGALKSGFQTKLIDGINFIVR